jgi:Trypsin
MSRIRFTGCAVALLACLATAAPADAKPARASVVAGTQIAITAAPWQVYVHNDKSKTACGGSVLDATRVLTAAHCVNDGTANAPAASITVLAGASDVAGWAPGQPTPSGAQVVKAASLRSHPFYTPAPYVADDVAVVTLAKALDLSTPRTKAIAMAPVGGTPAAGVPVQATGYGAQIRDQQPNGKLYAADLGALGDPDCLTSMTPNQSPSVLCATSVASATCYGDSGGPLTAGGVLVGVTSATSGQNPCTAPFPGLYADVTTPEIRAFIDGSDAPPRAPRLADQVGLSTLQPPVVGSPITCAGGNWTDGPSLSYSFMNDAAAQALQSGPAPTFAPAAAHVGMPISCVIQAANAGGVSFARTTAAGGIQADSIRPQAVLRSARCRKRRCKVRFQAADSNSLGALTVRVAAERRVRGWCRKGKGRKRHRVRCTKTRSKPFAVKHRGGVEWTATARRVPRGKATIRLKVRDAAGNKARGKYLKRRVRVR